MEPPQERKARTSEHPKNMTVPPMEPSNAVNRRRHHPCLEMMGDRQAVEPWFAASKELPYTAV